MKTVKEVSRITGVSVRTLHHYDAIGLLKPTAVTEAGYRLYDDAALKRMQSILLFRELQFPLKDIKRILDAPDFDPMTALAQQVRLLEMQREHLEQLISHAREIQQTGVFSMDFSKFDTSEIEKYTAEAKQKWGKTPAWQEFEKKNVTPRQAQESADDLMDIFARFGTIRGTSPASEGNLRSEELPRAHRRWSPSCKPSSRTTITPAPRKFCKVWGRCTLPVTA